MHARVQRTGRLVRLASLLLLAACQRFPPAVTGITIFPSDADGAPIGAGLARTRLQPPVPVIAVRPGSDPQQTSMFLNEPTSGRIAVTLARGTQHFLLFTTLLEQAPHYVIAIFLDGETLPALTCVVSHAETAGAEVSRAEMAIDLSGQPVRQHSALSADRDHYRVSLREALFPVPGIHIDAASPWRLSPDNIADAVGRITLDVQPL